MRFPTGLSFPTFETSMRAPLSRCSCFTISPPRPMILPTSSSSTVMATGGGRPGTAVGTKPKLVAAGRGSAGRAMVANDGWAPNGISSPCCDTGRRKFCSIAAPCRSAIGKAAAAACGLSWPCRGCPVEKAVFPCWTIPCNCASNIMGIVVPGSMGNCTPGKKVLVGRPGTPKLGNEAPPSGGIPTGTTEGGRGTSSGAEISLHTETGLGGHAATAVVASGCNSIGSGLRGCASAAGNANASASGPRTSCDGTPFGAPAAAAGETACAGTGASAGRARNGTSMGACTVLEPTAGASGSAALSGGAGSDW
mmetsp:Transcript_34694/g.95630  ORF Transcript_34694/g.95630 Transcript_34694/m.95630 type:complete len:309 (-) Transcript_34694:676-1602(-)